MEQTCGFEFLKELLRHINFVILYKTHKKKIKSASTNRTMSKSINHTLKYCTYTRQFPNILRISK